MIFHNFDHRAGRFMIVLQPNRSWTWRGNLYLLASLLVISLGVGTLFLLRELWLVLPFTLAEVLLVGASLYYCVRRTHQQEVITLTSETVLLERGMRRPEERQQFHRYFTRFFVTPPRHRGHGQRISLRCHKQVTEIGSFLTEQEKQQLVHTLREVIASLNVTDHGQRVTQPSALVPRQ